MEDTIYVVNDVSITVKAIYKDDMIKFSFSLFEKKKDLEEKVAKRLNLPLGSFKIKYLDEDNDWILATCDEDLHSSIKALKSLGKTTILMLVNQL